VKIIKNISAAIRFWFLKRAHSKITRTKKLLGYAQATSFGIIYDSSSEENYRQITLLVRDLQQAHKKVKTLGFVNLKKMPDYSFSKLTFEFCNAKNFSFNQQPTSSSVIDFISNDFDILIDLSPSYFFQMKYLCAVSGAKMKVGRYVEKYIDIYDLMLQIPDHSPLKETIEQIIHYLKMINNDQPS
jgi:hypothetical protein